MAVSTAACRLVLRSAFSVRFTATRCTQVLNFRVAAPRRQGAKNLDPDFLRDVFGKVGITGESADNGVHMGRSVDSTTSAGHVRRLRSPDGLWQRRSPSWLVQFVTLWTGVWLLNWPIRLTFRGSRSCDNCRTAVSSATSSAETQLAAASNGHSNSGKCTKSIDCTRSYGVMTLMAPILCTDSHRKSVRSTCSRTSTERLSTPDGYATVLLHRRAGHIHVCRRSHRNAAASIVRACPCPRTVGCGNVIGQAGHHRPRCPTWH